MYFWYRFFTYLFYPFAPIYLYFRKVRKKEDSISYKEKLATIEIAREEGFLIWFHVASVGEAMSILPLIESCMEEKKINKILLTSITLSSGKILKKRFNQNVKVIHQFLPLDISVWTNKFLEHWKPNLSIFIDSEIWPNLIFNIKERNIPLLLVNGRITKKTFLRWKFMKNFAKRIFEKFDLCIVANKETEKYLKTLGAQNIKYYGNIKFAKTKINSNNKLDTKILNKLKNKKVWCAASTHPSEEIFCAETHLKIKKSFDNILTIIIPRHIDRINTINKELSKLNLKIILFSNLDQMGIDTDILLVDTYGEALKFFNISKCVFLGKSLIKNLLKDSGQNPIEPSRLGCKIFHGPNVSNFAEIYEYLKSLGIANEVHTTEELSQSLVEEFKKDEPHNDKIIEKIENYGRNTLYNVFEEIKTYINT